MWGDIETAAELDTNHPLSKLLLQAAGPANISLNDARWQQIFLEYEILVHLDPQSNSLVQTAANAMARNACSSSNLAALTLHVSRMMRDLQKSVEKHSHNPSSETEVELTGKGRATCASLNLLRIFVHSTITSCCARARVQRSQESKKPSEYDLISSACLASSSIKETFLYREISLQTRYSKKETARNAAVELLEALVFFLSIRDPPSAIYDAVVYAYYLFFILFSTQLYQPMISTSQIKEAYGSLSRKKKRKTRISCNCFLDGIMHEAFNAHTRRSEGIRDWSHALFSSCIFNVMERPRPPQKSISLHHIKLLKTVVSRAEVLKTRDGAYESSRIVQAELANDSETPQEANSLKADGVKDDIIASHADFFVSSSKKGLGHVITMSSMLLRLPFRIMRLAMSTIGLIGEGEFDEVHQLLRLSDDNNEVIWLSESPLADLSSCALLLLTNNYRSNGDVELLPNVFCEELKNLNDIRWGDSADTSLYKFDAQGLHEENANGSLFSTSTIQERNHVAINFDHLFEVFGMTAHNELGALLLYTFLQSSPSFSASVAARSDLDTLIMPLLRTLYFSSKMQLSGAIHGKHVNLSGKEKKSNKKIKPFRSESHLYVTLILLLLFSQDSSFGKDAFRRVMIPSVSWYKERHLKDISLGSILLLSLLRTLTFNLTHLRDNFLLSNCCAVLLNLSPHVVNLHNYAAMRLISVTVLCCKNYMFCARQVGKTIDDPTSMIALYGEASRCLLHLLRQCFRKEAIDKNLDVVYALLYEQKEFKSAVQSSDTPFHPSEVSYIIATIDKAVQLIEKTGEVLSAEEAMSALRSSVHSLITLYESDEKNSADEICSFTYEEESDPEIFFVPYLWDVIVCIITAGSLEWSRSNIQLLSFFSCHDENENEKNTNFSEDMLDIV